MGVLLLCVCASMGTEKLIGICLREHMYGIQIPQGAWHTIEVYEPSTILEAKDGKYEPIQECDVLRIEN